MFSGEIWIHIYVTIIIIIILLVIIYLLYITLKKKGSLIQKTLATTKKSNIKAIKKIKLSRNKADKNVRNTKYNMGN